MKLRGGALRLRLAGLAVVDLGADRIKALSADAVRLPAFAGDQAPTLEAAKDAGAAIAEAPAVAVETIDRDDLARIGAAPVDDPPIPDRLSDPGLERSNLLLQNLIDLDTATDRARDLAAIPMWLVKIGALVNFVVLLLATVCPQAELSAVWTWSLLALCILPIGIGTSCLFLIADYTIGRKERSLTW